MGELNCIDQCRSGDTAACKQVYDRYARPLYSTALRMLGNRHDAEDAVQTVFLKAFRGLQDFRGEAAFSTWLFRILMNECRDQRGKKKPFCMEPAVLPAGSVNPGYDTRLTLEKAIQELPEQQKACFILFAVEEMKQEDIAGILNVSVGTVKSNIHHARTRLKSVLAETRKENLS